MRLANETLGKFHETAKGDLNTSKEAVAKLVAPLKQHLETYQQRLSESEKAETPSSAHCANSSSPKRKQPNALSETEQLRMILTPARRAAGGARRRSAGWSRRPG
ncbi:MAG: hypothetical protein CM1200mP34_5390 [Verrucomicrobiales bacterium]|nr:MAG: hypothetical protein CM1200mP34_5390 [Verrucomicrobiales bacterium]